VTSRRDRYAVNFAHLREVVYQDLAAGHSVSLSSETRDGIIYVSTEKLLLPEGVVPDDYVPEMLKRIIAAARWSQRAIGFTGHWASSVSSRAA
jgi:hypothetical protein